MTDRRDDPGFLFKGSPGGWPEGQWVPLGVPDEPGAARPNVVEFLRARLDEDAQQEWHRGDTPHACAVVSLSYYDGRCDCGGPERVLREVEAKRRIVDDLAELVPYRPHEDYDNTDNVWTEIQAERAERHLRLLASVHADHPDYDEEWRP